MRYSEAQTKAFGALFAQGKENERILEETDIIRKARNLFSAGVVKRWFN